MKRLLSFMVALSLMIGIGSTCAYAAEPTSTTVTSYVDENGTLVIVASSEEEYECIIKEMEEHNAYVQQLWQNALMESQLAENQMSSEILATQRGYEVNSVDHTDWVGFLTAALITFSASYTTTTDTFGNTIIGTVRYIDAYGRNSLTELTVNDYSYTYLDGQRTLATNYSCRVDVGKTDTNGNITYSSYTRQYYVEFHVGRSAKVY